MRFTVIGHSCLYVETRAGSILVDPWLIGSCYWRAWWHYPPADLDPRWLQPDYVYLTHHHFDHFHYPSMRLLDRGTQVLVPRFGVEVMGGEVRGLGFDRVTELPSGEVVDLGHGVRIASYQYGFDDTTFVVSDGATTLVDVNDCKIRGRPLRRVVEEFGRPTFLFKNYSWSQSYPLCYEADDPADLALVSRDTYLDDFVGRLEEAAPRYGVPFGSMVAFLHPETRDLNRYLIPPQEIADAWARTHGTATTEVVAMAPGDSWDAESGFRLSDVDWYSDLDAHLDRLAAEVQPTLDREAEMEAGRTLDWDAFAAYFGAFVHALPPLTGRFVVRRPVVFEVPSSAQPYWVVDVGRRAVYRLAAPPPGRANVTRVPEAVLADAIDKRIVQVIHGSMRIRVALEPGGASDDLAFWGLVMIWELGYLRARTLLRPRFVAALWRRRDEAREALTALRGHGTFLERMARRFATVPGASDERRAA